MLDEGEVELVAAVAIEGWSPAAKVAAPNLIRSLRCMGSVLWVSLRQEIPARYEAESMVLPIARRECQFDSGNYRAETK